MEREKDELVNVANEELILKLLPVLDNFGRALTSVPRQSAKDDWVKGMELVEHNLSSILAAEGLSRIDSKGKEFDPQEHEAVFIEKGSAEEQGKVKSIIRDGYRLHEKVIRPAQVSVTKGIKPGPKPELKQSVPVRRGGDPEWERLRVAPGVRGMFL